MTTQTDTKKKCLIIIGGDYAPFTENVNFDFVIACDKGYIYADKMGIKYDLVIGDFDSSPLDSTFKVPVMKLPVEKDDTDTVYAVKYALDHGYEDIYIICAFGGRLDHTIANMQTAALIASRGGIAHLYGDGTQMHCFAGTGRNTSVSANNITDSKISCAYSSTQSSCGVEGAQAPFIRIQKRRNTHLSVFSLSDKCTGVTIIGTKYGLNDANITNQFPVGVSNEWNDTFAEISVKTGIIAVVLSEQP